MSNESKEKTPFWKKGFGSKSTVTTGDGVAIFSEAYTDKTIYERFEQPFQCSADNVETFPMTPMIDNVPSCQKCGKYLDCNVCQSILLDDLLALRASNKDLEEKLRVCKEALELSSKFWYSDHPNDTVEGCNARKTIEAALASLSGIIPS